MHSTSSQIFLTKAKLTKLAGNSIVVDAIREVFKEAIEIKEIIEQYKKTNKGKYNHEIEFLLEEKLPMELIMYKDEKLVIN